MKALHIAYTEYSSDPRVRRQAEALVAAGWDVSVLAIARPGIEETTQVDGVEVHSLTMDRYRGAALGQYVTAYRRFIQWAIVRAARWRRTIDYAQVHTVPDFAVVSALPARIAGTPVVLDIHDLTPELFEDWFEGRRRWLRSGLRLSERISAGLASHVLTVSQTFRKRLLARGVPEDKLTVIMNLPDPKIFWRPDLPLPPPQPTLSYHGTLVRRYGPDILLEAAARLVPDFPDLRVVVIGDGDQKEELAVRAARPDLAGRVRISPARIPTDEIPDALGPVTAGVVANRPDGFARLVLSTKFMEYLAMGIPAVITKTEGLLDHFDPTALFTVDAATPDAFARALAGVIDDPGEARKRTAAAREFFDEHNWTTEAARYVDLVERLAGG